MLSLLGVLCGCRSLPPGVNMAGTPVPIESSDVRLLIDSTAWDTDKEERVIEQEIFDALLQMIDRAHSAIVLDLFLWNQMGTSDADHRALSGELVDALLRRHTERPELEIIVLTDPINALYGTEWDPQLQRLRDAGIPVVLTDLDQLRDSHVLYAAPARSTAWILDRVPHPSAYLSEPRLPNPFDAEAPRLSYQQVGRLLYFKANHRKVALVDDENGDWTVLVTSFNPHNASSAHSNIGFQLRGEVARQALESELDCIEWSSRAIKDLSERAEVAQVALCIRAAARQGDKPATRDGGDGPTVQWLTEQAIRDKLVSLCDDAVAGATIRIGIFYLSERRVISAIRRAARRGVSVRMIMDPNRDAFGRRKNGVPNRIVARELVVCARRRELDLDVRWADTHGEQFHTKAICVRAPDGSGALLCGSANWTRRNLNNLNMEAVALVEGDPASLDRFCEYFDRAWSNSDGLIHTLPYSAYAEGWWSAFWKGCLYRIGEHLGSSTF
ncbi:MAG: phospholipase [Kiritimatiellae bacterium]|nr:phospholipase [Kiritimatiellia bacterium]